MQCFAGSKPQPGQSKDVLKVLFTGFLHSASLKRRRVKKNLEISLVVLLGSEGDLPISLYLPVVKTEHYYYCSGPV